MKKLMLLLIIPVLFVSQGIQANDETTYNFKCEGPKPPHFNKFSLTGSVTVPALIEEAIKLDVEKLNLKIVVKKAGFYTVATTLEASDLTGEFSFINDNSWTKYPFYRLSLLPEDRDNSEIAYINLLMNYPGKLNSSIRTKDGYTYRGQCVLVPIK